jgi:hypothetical protein
LTAVPTGSNTTDSKHNKHRVLWVSSSRACAYTGLLRTRAETVALKSRVSAISLSLRFVFLALSVAFPQFDRLIDILLLALLGAACQQDDDPGSLLRQIDPASRAPVDLVLAEAGYFHRAEEIP